MYQNAYYWKILFWIFCFLGSINTLQSQDIQVSGVVTNASTKEPISSVAVVVKDTKNGVLTDETGRYQLSVSSKDAILVFSYYGFEKIEIPIQGRSQIDLAMSESVNSLDEVVVVGYGTQRKKFITGAISRVSQEEIEGVPNISVQSTLQGRAAGVQVTTSDAMAGAPVSIRVRGTSSVSASSEPLYVVDGIPIISGNVSVNNASSWAIATANETNALAQLNPADIASIEVLKDAAASAIYGSRASNGVVLITTKQGKSGKTKFDLGYYAGWSKETHRIKMLDGPSYLALGKEAWANSGRDISNDYAAFYNAILPDGLTREVADRTNTDWLDYALQKGFLQEATASASGGNDKTTFFIGGTFRDEIGIFTGNSFRRINGRVNLDHKVGDKFSIGARTAITYIDNDRIPISWAGGLGVAQSTALPFFPVYNEDGTYFKPRSGNNVVAQLDHTDMNNKSNAILSNLYAQFKILPNLTFRSEFGLNNIYRKESYYKSAVLEPLALATSVLSENTTWNTNNFLNFNQSFGKHSLDLMGGMNAQKGALSQNIINGEGFSNPSLRNPQNAATRTANINTTQFSFVSFFGRLGYRFDDRYILNASIRRDASSRFGPDKRWGSFPAISVGYILSEEEFLKNSKFINFLKFRAGFGYTGNAEIGNFRYLGSYQTSNYVNTGGIVVNNLNNPTLGWETANQLDLGLDFGLLDERIQGTIDVYRKETQDFLLNVEVSALTGASSSTINAGKLENKGIELDITSYNLTGDFRWTTQFNISHNQNKVTELAPNINFAGLFGGGSEVAVGYPVGVRKTVPYAGVAERDMTLSVTDANTLEQIEIQVSGGDMLFTNQFDELTNIYDPRDLRFLGSAYPTWTGGLSNRFEFKGLDLGVLFTFATGHDLNNSEQTNQHVPFGYGWTAWDHVANRWTQDGDQTDVPKLGWLAPRTTSSRIIYDADYVRLKDLSVGYTFPSQFLEKLNLGSLRIYVRGTNILTFTKYPGWDPEYNRDGADSDNQGSSWLPSPQAKSVTVGANLNF